MELQPIYIQILALVLFTIGLITTLARRNVFFVLMGVELALNAVNLSFVGFAKTLPAELSVAGQIVPLFSIAVAAAEACVGLALVILIFRNSESVDSDNYSNMKG
ncbi:NADH-quinone oxidoreductase subunit K [Fibrobacter sp. UWB1]|uniref:NADH-quinone oxidoreductase subunit NuoK n=1 Tax=Fibrobacter sp. UWB1 TaxID=1964355 RepID=UPI000B5216C2|nr:NADH-quinone oxidoreductase subunit NuoK [Fibrobacter sp. UWB1]OWV27312.1 NADH-quinone oxidoreductase subunit K [Fibrobacter sp. UWB1]